MKSLKKVMGIIVGVLVVLLVIVIIASIFFLGSIVKTAVNTGGPAVLGVPVTLEQAHVFPIRGKVSMKELVIGNPEGFKTPYLFKMGALDVRVKMSSVATDTVLIKKVHIDGPEIVYERGLKASNVSALMASLEGEPEEEPAEEEEPEEEAEEEGEGTKVVLEDFLLENGRIKLSATLTGGRSIVLPLPTIHLTDVGKDSEGASVKEVVQEVFGAIFGTVTKTVTASVNFVGDGVEVLKDAKIVDETGKVISGAASKTADVAKDAAQAGTKAVKGAADMGTKAAKGAADKGTKAVKGVGKQGKRFFRGVRDKAKEVVPGKEE